MFISKTEYKYLLKRLDVLENIVRLLEREACQFVDEQPMPLQEGEVPSRAGFVYYLGYSLENFSNVCGVKEITKALLNALGYRISYSKAEIILEKANARTKKG